MSNTININATANTMKAGHRTVTFSVYGKVQKNDSAGIPATSDVDLRNYLYYPFNGKTTASQALGVSGAFDTFYQAEFKTPLMIDKIEVCLAREDNVTSVSMYVDYTDGMTDTFNITPSVTSGSYYNSGAAQLKRVNPNSTKKVYRIRIQGLIRSGVSGRTYFGLCYVTLYGDASYAVMAKSETPINLLDKSSITGITTEGIQPTNTSRHVAFKVDDKWKKLTIGSGGVATLTALATQDITVDSLIAEGNTTAELANVTSVPGFVGKLVYPAVALYAGESATVMPTFGMTVKAKIDTTVNVYSYTTYSQEYAISDGEDVPIVSVVTETETTGNGAVDITARIKSNGEWSDYMSLNSVQMKNASALQLKAVYTVQSTTGNDSAKIKGVIIKYNTSGAITSNSTTDIVTVTERFTNDLTYVHAYVKHKELVDAQIKVCCSLRKTPSKRIMYQFGNGTGALKTFTLPDSGINQDTLLVYVDGKLVYDFGYNTETSEITISADKDTVLSASYEYGWGKAEWIEMEQGVSQINDGGAYTTEYSYTIPEHEGELTVTAIKYELIRPEGKVTDEIISIGTGKRQIIQLPHFARKETIQCNGKWSYDYDSKRLTVIAPEGDNIVISYDWIAESPQVYGVMAGWAD